MANKDLVLIIEDNSLNRELLRDILEDDYDIMEAENGKDGLDIILSGRYSISAVLLDLMMPVMDGIEVLEELNKHSLLDIMPVLIVSGDSNPLTETKCLELGVFDFIKKPFVPSVAVHRISNAISLFNYKSSLEDKIEEQTVVLREQADELRKQNIRLQDINEKTIEFLSDVVEARDLESGTHVHRVKTYTRILADKLREKYPEYGLDEEKVRLISLASSTHDVGKIMISDTILLKPGKLTNEEFDIMKQHTVLGCKVLERGKSIWDEIYYNYCLQICRSHHEKYDGRGYPDGLSGDDIPVAAQIVAITDCYDALTTVRVYKPRFTHEEAYNMIMNGECGKMNPKLLDCLTEVRDVFEKIGTEMNKTGYEITGEEK